MLDIPGYRNQTQKAKLCDYDMKRPQTTKVRGKENVTVTPRGTLHHIRRRPLLRLGRIVLKASLQA